MTDHSPAILASRIHTPGCPWSWTFDCEDDLSLLREEDEEAAEMLDAKVRWAFEKGLPPTENSNRHDRRRVTHRCPVGDRVLELDDNGFTDDRPMPWAGELYAESHDCRTLYRLYFVERRAEWAGETDEIVASGLGSKPVAEDASWTSDDQTRTIRDAMHSGIERCVNVRRVWRRWNTT
ncbi:hypothetical protein [Tsukamurella soli]|uniref:hypothetical protein n=1 Tax=Tsukamurella soli TaxID=644556 RepID=UPI0031EFF916